mmetsp:Transcript_2183/g.5046  ORF Transcript_2183/g.5046 Transcript_2183/m.5046 type:complete len:94 (+) Transcript_2183:482-763(+)
MHQQIGNQYCADLSQEVNERIILQYQTRKDPFTRSKVTKLQQDLPLTAIVQSHQYFWLNYVPVKNNHHFVIMKFEWPELFCVSTSRIFYCKKD